jgi:hypothetical protein
MLMSHAFCPVTAMYGELQNHHPEFFDSQRLVNATSAQVKVMLQCKSLISVPGSVLVLS